MTVAGALLIGLSLAFLATASRTRLPGRSTLLLVFVAIAAGASMMAIGGGP